jgi:hypothetical protein
VVEASVRLATFPELSCTKSGRNALAQGICMEIRPRRSRTSPSRSAAKAAKPAKRQRLNRLHADARGRVGFQHLRM